MGRDPVQGYFNQPPAWHRRPCANLTPSSKDAEDTAQSQYPKFSYFPQSVLFLFLRSLGYLPNCFETNPGPCRCDQSPKINPYSLKLLPVCYLVITRRHMTNSDLCQGRSLNFYFLPIKDGLITKRSSYLIF